MAAVLGFYPLGPSASADSLKRVCANVQQEIDKYARSLPNLESLEQLSPFMSTGAMKALRTHLRAAGPKMRGAIYQAIGRARHSESLRILLGVARPSDERERLALALGLLSLGDGTRSATITRALRFGPVAERRMLSHALAQMNQFRPRRMLRFALQDDDERVRLSAVTQLSRRPARSIRKILVTLTQSDHDDVRRAAAALLLRGRYRLDSKVLTELPEPMRSQLYVSAAARTAARITHSLKRDVFSKDRNQRNASLASMVHVMPLKRFLVVQKKLKRKFKKSIGPELAMVLALYDQTKGWSALDQLQPKELERAIEVLIAYTGAGRRRAGLSLGHAARFANRFEAWMTTSILRGETEQQLLEIMQSLEAELAHALALKRLEFQNGPGLHAALNLISSAGSVSDVSKIIAIYRNHRNPKTRVLMLRSAALLCR